MNFSEALRAMRQGKRVCRPHGRLGSLELRFCRIEERAGRRACLGYHRAGEGAHFELEMCFSLDDIEAQDWGLYEE